MKKIIIFLLICCSHPVTAIEINNFKSGLVCTDGKTFGWVCHETDTIYISGQGECTFNGKEKPCTWYGFQFDYTKLDKKHPVSCTITTTESANYGNPNEITDKDSKSTTYELPLKPDNTHFFNPQYAVLAVPEKPPFTRTEYTTCHENGHKIFEFKFNYVYPKKP